MQHNDSHEGSNNEDKPLYRLRVAIAIVGSGGEVQVIGERVDADD
jgi:hypothetical protein